MITVQLTALTTVEAFKESVVYRRQRLLILVVVLEVPFELSNSEDADQRVFVMEVIPDKSVVCSGFRLVGVATYKVFLLKM